MQFCSKSKIDRIMNKTLPKWCLKGNFQFSLIMLFSNHIFYRQSTIKVYKNTKMPWTKETTAKLSFLQKIM